jgi:hypothetical protein
MILALAAALLMSPPTAPTFWIERGARAIIASADLRPLIDADLRRRLTSGLTTTLVLTLQLRDEDNALIGGTLRVARARYDLWHEQVAVVLDGPNGSRTETYASVNLFLRAFAQVRSTVIAPLVPRDARLYRLHARLEVNPLSDAQLARMRRWLAQSPDGTGLDPLRGTLLGSFVRFFDNLKPGVAERRIDAVAHPVRGDRMPSVQPVGPPVALPSPAPPPPAPVSTPAPPPVANPASEASDGSP